MKSNRFQEKISYNSSWRIVFASLFVLLVVLVIFGLPKLLNTPSNTENNTGGSSDNKNSYSGLPSDNFSSENPSSSSPSTPDILIASSTPIVSDIQSNVFEINESKISTSSTLNISPTPTSSTPSKISTSSETLVKTRILQIVPFTSQAPLGEWNDDRFQDGCEEASVLMAMKWAKGGSIKLDKAGLDKVRSEILDIVAYEQKILSNYHDTSAADTLEYLIKGYFTYTRAEVKQDITITDLIKELEAGNIIIAPTNGRLLKNPNFTAPGPERHMLVIIGYDYKNKKFITNDPGTRRGAGYQYPEEILEEAIADYPSGWHKIAENRPKNVIIIKALVNQKSL